MADFDFPLQFKRQYAAPLDLHSQLSTTNRTNWLSDGRRYAGQIVYDTDLFKLYALNSGGTAWLEVPVSSSSSEIQLTFGLLTVDQVRLNSNTVTTAGANNLVINTNEGTNSSSITVNQGVNGHIILFPNGTGDVGIGTTTPNELLTVAGNLSASGNLVIDGNTTIGNASTDTVTFNARVNTNFIPSTDNARDLGSSTLEFKDLWIDGVANIDALSADAVNIDGGTIDGVAIGEASVATIVRVDNLQLDSNTISSINANGHILLSPNGTGDVGIGTTTPNELLTVAGNISASGNVWVTQNLEVSSLHIKSTDLVPGGQQAGFQYSFKDITTNYDPTSLSGQATAPGTLYIKSNNASISNAPAQIVLQPALQIGNPASRVVALRDNDGNMNLTICCGDKEVMRLKNEFGLVRAGIGTADSKESLTVSGNISASGIIFSNSTIFNFVSANETPTVYFDNLSAIGGGKAFLNLLPFTRYRINYDFAFSVVGSSPVTVVSGNRGFDILCGNVFAQNTKLLDIGSGNTPSNSFTIFTKFFPTTIVLGMTGDYLGNYATDITTGSYIESKII
jgi:hypothetical protein